MTKTNPTADASKATWSFFIRNRRYYFFLTLITIVLGLASRRFDAWLPVPIHKNAGDVLWAVMVYWIFALLFPARSIWFLGSVSALYAIAIECAKLLKFPWLVAFRATTAGHLIFGAVFSWTDLLDYGIGILIAVFLDYRMQAGSRLPADSFPKN